MRVPVLLAAAALLAVACTAQDRARPSSTTPYAQWKRGLPADPGYFPIAVWLQSPSNASKFKAAGINLYVALWQGPTAEQLAQLKAAGMPVIVGQSQRSLAFIDDPTIVGWMHGDEPDNAQEVTDPKSGRKGYGPCIPPPKIVEDYKRIKANDPSRPIMLNLGQGVANDGWNGRGSGAKLDDYKTYVQGSDITSFDVYPVATNLKPVGDNLGYVSKGIDRLTQWSGGSKIIWNCIECTQIDGTTKASPSQVRAETWLSLIHGSRGIIYFVHQFKPKFNEHALLDDPEMLRSVTATNQQIKELAPVLNSPTLAGHAVVTPAAGEPGIDAMAKQYRSATYVFAVNTHPTPVKATVAVRGARKRAAVELVGEGKNYTASDRRFEAEFQPYEVHIFRVR